jgi:hypothetical protein
MTFDIPALKSAQSWWELAGYVSLATVLIGVIGESVHEFFTRFGSSWWRLIGGKASALVLIAGLAAEGITQVKTNSISDQITAVLDRENLEIREKVAGRRITKEQHDILVSELSKAPAVFDIEALEEGEASLYASDIFHTLTDAKWTSNSRTFPHGVVWTGLVLFQTDDPAAVRLGLALKSAQIPFSIGDQRRDRVTIMVGAKPSPF